MLKLSFKPPHLSLSLRLSVGLLVVLSVARVEETAFLPPALWVNRSSRDRGLKVVVERSGGGGGAVPCALNKFRGAFVVVVALVVVVLVVFFACSFS